MFLGYPPHIKGYKVYNLQTHKVLISRDVKFLETHFPFSKSTVSPNADSSSHDITHDFIPDSVPSGFTPYIPPHPSSPPPLVTSQNHNTPLPDNFSPDTLSVPDSDSELLISSPDVIPEPSTVSPPVLRRSQRVSVPNVRMKDYYVKLYHNTILPSSSSQYPLCNFVDRKSVV